MTEVAKCTCDNGSHRESQGVTGSHRESQGVTGSHRGSQGVTVSHREWRLLTSTLNILYLFRIRLIVGQL